MLAPCVYRRLPLASLLLILPGLACSRSVPLTANSLAGCWAFERQVEASVPLGAIMPDTVWLDTVPTLAQPHRGAEPQRRLTVLSRRVGAEVETLRRDSAGKVLFPPDWPQYYALTAWRIEGPASVVLIFHANMSTGWRYRLRPVQAPDGTTLVGRAVMYSDVVSDTVTQIPVLGRRVLCPRQARAAA